MEKKVQLEDYQKEHYERIIKILNYNYFFIDGSTMGSGKSMHIIKYCQDFNIECIIIAPALVLSAWKKLIDQYSVQVVKDIEGKDCLISYDRLRSIKNNQPYHGFLKRYDKEGEPVKFFGTSFLFDMIKKGVLIIFDECQEVKNAHSDQTKAVKTIFNCVYEIHKSGERKTKIGLLTGTIADKPEHCINYMQMIGVISNKTDNNMKHYIIDEMIKNGKSINPEGDENFHKNDLFKIHGNTIDLYIYNYWINVIRPVYMVIMPKDPKLDKDAKFDVADVCYPLDNINYIKYNEGLNELNSLVRGNKLDNNINYKSNIGNMMKTLIKIQTSKASLAVNIIKAIFNHKYYNKQGEELHPKVIAYAKFQDVWDVWLDALKEYKPLELTGRIPQKERPKYIDFFQADDDEYRLIIGNNEIAGQGINLQDKKGLRPRIIIIIPDYNAINLQQSIRRIFRNGTKGIAMARIIYSFNTDIQEISIAKTIARKGECLNQNHSEQNIIFPGQYPIYNYEKVYPYTCSDWIVKNQKDEIIEEVYTKYNNDLEFDSKSNINISKNNKNQTERTNKFLTGKSIKNKQIPFYKPLNFDDIKLSLSSI